MKKAKLTLTVDPGLLARAKVLAKERGASLSGLIEGFFERLLEQKQNSLGDTSGANPNDPWVNQMDTLLDAVNKKRLSEKDIIREINRDHDDFEKELIEDRSQEFLP